MRKLALLVAAVGFVAVLSVPPAHAQAKCGNDVCFGSSATQIHAKGNIIVDRPILTGTSSPVIIDGGLTVVGAMAFTGTIATAKADVIDAGVLQVMGKFQCGSTAICGSVALSSATPSTATVTVPAGASCACWPVGGSAAIAAGGCAANVSSTTLTLTGPNSVTTTMRYMCFF